MSRSAHARHLFGPIACLVLLAGCGRAEDDAAVEEAPPDETVPFVPDSTIEREIQKRLTDEPRLDVEGVEIAVHTTEQQVTLVGQVPSRIEWQIAREIALSSPGVKTVYLDSLTVLSEQRNRPTTTSEPPPRS